MTKQNILFITIGALWLLNAAGYHQRDRAFTSSTSGNGAVMLENGCHSLP